jgi:serine/threonine protein kinase
MTGLSWTYETLCNFIPSLTYHSSSPTSAADLNPIIKQLLTVLPGSSVFGVGGHSVLLLISEDIAAKVSLKPGDAHLRHEQTIFELLNQKSCPSIIRIFLRYPDVTFMQLLRNGTLYQRMSMVHKPVPILRWMRQLADAVACVESLGYAHGDINPRNILFGDDDELKLIDFDHALDIGADLDVGEAPYVRAQKVGSEGGTFGVAGPATEQFALGSIFWYITRGTELYAELEGSERVNRLIDGQFPPTDPQDPIDNIIKNCWNGSFASISDLSKDIRGISTLSDPGLEITRCSDTYIEKKKKCEHYYQLLKRPSCQ